jgi:hypothetical protein
MPAGLKKKRREVGAAATCEIYIVQSRAPIFKHGSLANPIVSDN